MRGLPKLLARLGRPPPAVGQTPADAVHSENKWRLLRFRPRSGGSAYHTPVLMVPSLINRWYVLDLKPGRSLVEYLVARGHDVFVIDWGTPGPEDRFLSFDDICDRIIGRALRVAAREAGSGAVHLLGYCMGGTLTAVHTAARPGRVASLVQLAAPISFDEGGLLSAWTRCDTFDVRAMEAATGNVPAPLMQSAFHMIRPTLGLSKVVHMLDRDWDDESLEGLLALERWGGDNVSFPGACYRTWVERLYRGDELRRGTMTLSGRPAHLGSIRCPLLCVTFENDGIVPAPSAAALLDLVSSPDAEHLHLPGGHVGAVVSRAGRRRLWPRLSAFWAERDTRGAQACD